mmetsp:Transcript_23408/g.63200  ORF Transcript_23408/g.63200 Transcript_23408/m.63200 type:complete len:100 (-) Transcript_23408:28-327(-)
MVGGYLLMAGRFSKFPHHWSALRDLFDWGDHHLPIGVACVHEARSSSVFCGVEGDRVVTALLDMFLSVSLAFGALFGRDWVRGLPTGVILAPPLTALRR